jgi:oligopeptidase A
MSTLSNPLLDFADLTAFDAVAPEHVTPAIDALLAENRALVAQLEAPIANVSWENFIEPLDQATEKLGRAWGVVGHLYGVADTPALRAAYNENQPKITEFFTELGQNLKLFEQYKRLAASPAFANASPTKKRIIENALRDFRLSGAELPQAQKKRFAEIQEIAAKTSSRFSENVLDATNDFHLDISDEAELDGIPPDAVAAARACAEQAGLPGYRFTLHFPSFFPVLQFAKRRSLRETMYRANFTKASDQGSMFSEPEKWDNSDNILTLLQLRLEEAKLLGYRNFAEVSLVPKMAQSPQQVIEFLQDLGRRARPHAERDLAQLREFAAAKLDLPELQAWDLSFASEKLREAQYAFSQQELKQYFPAPKVLQGLFDLIQKLYHVTILPQQASVWHPAVGFYRIERDGELIAQFYLDLYARSGKKSGAWMSGARNRRRFSLDGQLQTPIAYLVCNFTPPQGDQPALLTHGEVTTLFHEFGHGLHHMLTRVEELSASGIHGVEWDAVELPSQFMENYCWEWDVLAGMSGHIDSGKPLPRELFDKMIAAKNFQSGMATLRQVEFSLCDMLLHHDFEPQTKDDVQQLISKLRQELSLMPPPPFNRFQHAFSHIFAGGYAAGYYSYKWAEVLSSDAYAAFEESDDQAAVGRRFENEILAVGGSRPALASFQAFRGRDPQIDALLRHSGMAEPASS